MSKSIIKRMREANVPHWKVSGVRANLEVAESEKSIGVSLRSINGTVTLPSGFVVDVGSRVQHDGSSQGWTDLSMTVDGRRYYCYIPIPTYSRISLRRLAVAFAERVIAGQLEGAKK
jgi:hypothetical protein